LQFPLTVPADEDQRIEVSLDQGITTPYNYSFNFSYGREIGKGLSFEASYVGRWARNILASRDIMQLNNIRDPQSGLSYYDAINALVTYRYANREITSIPDIPFFNNLFPFMPEWWGDTTLTPTQAAYAVLAPEALGGADIVDYTFLQLLWDDSPNCTSCPFEGGPAKFNNMFYQPQFGALSAFSTIAHSNYNSLQLSVRQRLRDDITFDFNYTYGHSLDNASGLQRSGSYGTAFIVNALFPDQNYATSDFDARHIINANWVVGLPFGRGKRFFGNAGGITEQVFGGWPPESSVGIVASRFKHRSTAVFGQQTGTCNRMACACNQCNRRRRATEPMELRTCSTIRLVSIAASVRPGRAKWATATSFVLRDTFPSTWGSTSRSGSRKVTRCNSVGRSSTSRTPSGLTV
jgi:hypothetical protein